ncbi:MAG: ABC transporter permease [Rhizobiales bacterium]|nr:ABC transporter permease [Hyphomicrobiales bacterium]MBI3673016.1 ABC transporter permease [Hyphomicrobiales bacterium]
MDPSLIPEILASSIRMAVPLILASLAGLWSERSGIVDIGLEGKMLAAAFAAASASFYFQSAWAGLFIAILVSLAMALVHGYASINQRGNQVVSGVAINMLAAGLAVVLGNTWFKEGGRTPALSEAMRFMPIDLPGATALADIPVLAGLAKIVSGHSLLTYLALALVPLSAWALARTRFGLRLRAVGENPHAVDTAGISVARLRYQAVIIAGVLCGIAGAYISTSLSASFVRDMSAGRGFMALAALIFANWRAWPALYTCLLFGFLQAIGNFMQGARIGQFEIPVQFFNTLPYLMTVVLLAGFIGKSIPPRASGIPYTKDR